MKNSINKEEVANGYQKKIETEPKTTARQIIIETDGNNIRLIKNETAGSLELAAILQTVLAKLIQRK